MKMSSQFSVLSAEPSLECILISPSKLANFFMTMKISKIGTVDLQWGLVDFPMKLNNGYSKISQLLFNNNH